MMFDYGDHMSTGGWWFMGIGMVLFWALVITAIVLLVHYLRPNPTSAHTGTQDAAAILAERFARGEISDEEYTAKRKLLSP